MTTRRLAPKLLPVLALLAACTNQAPEPEAEETEIPEELARASPAVAAGGGIGTPMAERVAVLGLLNKRNNISRDIELKPGEQRRIGDVVVRLSACERTAPWEEPPETGAFVQVLVQERADADVALVFLRRAVKAGFGLSLLARDGDLAPLRGHPNFKRLLGLAAEMRL